MSTHITQTSSFNRKLLTVLNDRNVVQDRLPGDRLALPNNMYDISVSVNDFVVSDTINYSLEGLYDNWLYLISSSIIPSNNIPNADYYTSIIADTPSTGLNWFNSTQFPEISSTTSNRSLSGINKITKLTNTVNSNNYNLIATTSTNVILLSGTNSSSIDVIINDQNTANIIRSDSSVTHPSNNINFISISNHLVNQSNELFVLDDSLRSLFKFDISGILTLDKAILNNDTPGRLMTAMAGGRGDITDKDKFHNPISMVSVDDIIHVIDYHPQLGSTIKSFDSQLNWKSNSSLGMTLSSGPIDIAYNTNTRKYYILCHIKAYNNNVVTPPSLVVYDEMFNFVESVDLMKDGSHNETIKLEKFKSIYFSIENPNILYLVSKENIYKKYISRPSDFIGRFKAGVKNIGTGDIGDMEYEDISITRAIVTHGDESIQKDEIFLYEWKYEVIHKFKEDSNYEQSLETQFDEKVLYLPELIIHPGENVNTFVYNKTLMKHIYNNALLLENTSRKFTTTYDIAGISQYVGFQYLDISELSTIHYITTMNNYIGVNEIVTTHTINRCLEEIYKLQLRLLSSMQEKPTNIYPLVSVPVILSVKKKLNNTSTPYLLVDIIPEETPVDAPEAEDFVGPSEPE